MSAPPVAFLDACVLWPLPLADFLLRSAHAGLCAVRWSAAVQREWAQAFKRRRPALDPGAIDARNAAMNEALPEALVSAYEAGVEDLELPDPDDRHVLAAAIHARADFIVTYNLRDFPPAALKARRLCAIDPDAFLHALHATAPERFARIGREIVAAWDDPRIDERGFFERLARLRLHRTAAALRGSVFQPTA